MPTTEEFITNCIRMVHTPVQSPEWDALYWAYNEMTRVVCDDPERALTLFTEIIERDGSDVVFGSLAAGPLESLLSGHGARVIDTVEELARQNPKFARLLGGVWKHEMSDEVWRRVQEVWDRSLWD